ncbi:hypothetical protein B0J11DRAFT_498034 [Dendryphion nanum]|uniref:MFS general substrate transporter n=1 Tax=Dendryphion nanum TaxID=256645 RepID=A0A9P9D4J5_9PLEO|nr:hypothetical protein B0J11DRAFT_498034 [Dendryphion nanum]
MASKNSVPLTRNRLSKAPPQRTKPASSFRSKHQASSNASQSPRNDSTPTVTRIPEESSAQSEDSPINLVQCNAIASPPLVVVKTAQLSPTQPIPKRNSLGIAHDIRRLSNAIEGLEDLVQEAVVIAEDSRDPNQMKEVYDIIGDATIAVQEASTLPVRKLMLATSPLKLSDSSEEAIAHRMSPAMPLVAPTMNPLEQHRDSIVVDWAYNNNNLHTYAAPSLSLDSSTDISRGRSGHSTQSDLLLPPQEAYTEPREHIEYVLRPTLLRRRSRGRSRRRRSSYDNEMYRPVTHHTHHRRSYDEYPRRRHAMPRSSSLGRYMNYTSEDKDSLVHYVQRPETPYGQELTVREHIRHHPLSVRRHFQRQPIARNWNIGRKRITATIACFNTALLGIIVGIYAGEVPRIQYVLADERHHVIVGNVGLYFGLAVSTCLFWPLPLLHGRKPYILASLALALPLQFPQAVVVSTRRSPNNVSFRTGLLLSRSLSGLILGFANVNFLTVLLDLFGASLQSKNSHQEIAVANDARRHGGGMGIWLGIWAWCWIGSLAIGFHIGAGIIKDLTPDWGFYIIIILLATSLVLNVLAPETRRSAYRKSVTDVYDRDENYITRRVARGEVKLHMSSEGPKYWFEEVWAGIKLTFMMCCQPGFFVLAFYLGWIYAQIVLVIVLLGALLSREYKWYPHHVGLGVMSIAIGGLLAIPLTKANVFSRERKNPFRTDSMTFQKQVTWSSHLIRRALFTLTLPLMGLAYTISSAGRPKPYMVPIVFAGAVGFLSILAIAECHGLIMETFDTCDLQAGVNTGHRFESLAVEDRRRRTNYSSFPRVTAGIFASQALAFIGAAAATEVGGIMTRHIGAQASTGVTAGILLGLTILLLVILWRFREVQVIPNHTFGTRRDTKAWEDFQALGKSDWKAVVIGNPSGKMRKMSVLELGGLSRWTEIRKLNYLIRVDEEKRLSRWT